MFPKSCMPIGAQMQQTHTHMLAHYLGWLNRKVVEDFCISNGLASASFCFQDRVRGRKDLMQLFM